MKKIVKGQVITSAVTGQGSLSIKIPGTYSGLDSTQASWQGRLLLEVSAWFSSPAAGDQISSISIQDTDGVVALGARSLFSAYPTIQSSVESSMAAANQGLYLPTSKPLQYSPSQTAKVSSGLYVVFNVAKGSAVSDTFNLNILWDDLS